MVILQLLPHIEINEISRTEILDGSQTLASADLLVGPWEMFHGLPNDMDAGPHRVLLPIPLENSTWVGVEHPSIDDLVEEAARVVQELALNETQTGSRSWSIGRWIATIVVGLMLLIILINVIGALSTFFF